MGGGYLSLINDAGTETALIRGYVSGTTQAYFNAGNVGVGTANATAKLHVSCALTGESLRATYGVSSAIIVSGAFFYIPNLTKSDWTTPAAAGDSVKWDATTKRLYGG